MLLLLLIFAIIHSGGAALRYKAESKIGPRSWRLFFATLSITSSIVLIGYFLTHHYDGIYLWHLKQSTTLVPFIWILTAISFLFLYPATYNLLEIPAVLAPRVRLYGNGIIRISRHPQAVGQVLWCLAHMLWVGSSFMLITSIGLITYHIFAAWHGDRRLKMYFGNSFDILKENTSILPFIAVVQGRQKFVLKEFIRPSQLGIVTAIGIFWWSHRFITLATIDFWGSRFERLLTWALYSPRASNFVG